MEHKLVTEERGRSPERGAAREEYDYERYRAVIERSGTFESAPGAVNLLGIRGYSDGRAVPNVPDEYNDTIAAIWRDPEGRRRVREFRATVDPGQDYTDQPMNAGGCAHLIDGQYVYRLGEHKGRPALVQAGPVNVWRDADRDHGRDGGEGAVVVRRGINIHSGGSGSRVGRWSAGCQVVHAGVDGGEWAAFLEIVRAHTGRTIRYTLVDRAMLGLEPAEVPAAEPGPASEDGPAAGRPTLRVGNRGTEVRELQLELRDEGHDPGPVDGIFGRKTERAVIAFQRARRLHADGIVGPETWTALVGGEKSLATGTGTRRALLVALNDYGDPRNNLPSCVADAQAFRAYLERQGFRGDDVRVLLDGDATVEAMHAELDWLFDGLTEDDRAVLYYSGHGYQTPIDDVLTEVLVLRDGFLLDDELSSRTQDIPDGVFTAVLDSCFSGGMDKIVFASASGAADFAAPKRWANAPANGKAAASEPTGYRRFGAQKSAGDEAGDPPLKGLMLAACSENETASASNARTRGLSAFTFALLEAVEEHGLEATSSTLMASVRSTLSEHGFRQTPTLFEASGPFRLAERSFVTLRADAGTADSTSSDDDVWTRLRALLGTPTMENEMDTEIYDDEAAEKILPFLAAIAPIALQLAGNAIRSGSNRGGRHKDFALGGPDFASWPVVGPTEDDEDDEEVAELEAHDKDFSQLVQAAMVRLGPVVLDGLSHLARNTGKRKPRRRPRRSPIRKAFSEDDIDEKAFRIALQMAMPLLRGSLRVHAS